MKEGAKNIMKKGSQNDVKVAATCHVKSTAKDDLIASTTGRFYVHTEPYVTVPIEMPDQEKMMTRCILAGRDGV